MDVPPALHDSIDHADFYKRYDIDSILCVEVGSSRIKATRFTSPVTKESLRKLKTIQAISEPWLKLNIEKLFEISEGNPLNELLDDRISNISLSIFGPLYQSGQHHLRTHLVPQNLVQHLENHTGLDVTVEVDSVTWALGAADYMKLDSKTLEYPALVITLGTSVGMAIMESENSVKSVEYGWTGAPFTRVKLLNERIFVLNMAYLNEISGGNIETLMQTYRATYNNDFQALVLDMAEHLENKYGVAPIKSLLVGGGFSRFIDPLDNLPFQSMIFNPNYLESEQVSPDIIQLLGCLKKAQEPSIKTDTLPDLETMLELTKPKS